MDNILNPLRPGIHQASLEHRFLEKHGTWSIYKKEYKIDDEVVHLTFIIYNRDILYRERPSYEAAIDYINMMLRSESHEQR